MLCWACINHLFPPVVATEQAACVRHCGSFLVGLSTPSFECETLRAGLWEAIRSCYVNVQEQDPGHLYHIWGPLKANLSNGVIVHQRVNSSLSLSQSNSERLRFPPRTTSRSELHFIIITAPLKQVSPGCWSSWKHPTIPPAPALILITNRFLFC